MFTVQNQMKRKLNRYCFVFLFVFSFPCIILADKRSVTPYELAFSLIFYLNVVAPVPPPAEDLNGYSISYTKQEPDPAKYLEKNPYTPRRTLPWLFANVDIPVYSDSQLSKTVIYTYSTVCISYFHPLLCMSSQGNRNYEEAKITEIYYNFLEITPLFLKYKIVMLGIPSQVNPTSDFIKNLN